MVTMSPALRPPTSDEHESSEGDCDALNPDVGNVLGVGQMSMNPRKGTVTRSQRLAPLRASGRQMSMNPRKGTVTSVSAETPLGR